MAALSVASRRLPGTTQRNVLPIASILCGMDVEPIELPRLDTCPGVACCQPIELPSYKATPLQRVGLRDTAGAGERSREVTLKMTDLTGYHSPCFAQHVSPRYDRA